MGRAAGHELDLLPRREAPVVHERTIVDVRPTARANSGPVSQLIAGYWLRLRQPVGNVQVHSPPRPYQLGTQLSQPVAVPAPGPNLRGDGAGGLRKTESPFQQVAPQVGPNGCDRHLGDDSVWRRPAGDENGPLELRGAFDHAGARLPIKAGQHSLQQGFTRHAVLPALAHLAAHEPEHGGQVLWPSRPHAVALAVTSCTSGSARRIISSSSVSTWCACSRLTSPASSATTCAWMRLCRS